MNKNNGHERNIAVKVAAETSPTPSIQNYVTGFVHDAKGHFLLLRKTCGPAEVIGKLNGIGGKVEATDFFPTSSMEREAIEELGRDFGLIWHTLGLVYSERDFANIIFHAKVDDLNEMDFPKENDRGEKFGIYTMLDTITTEDAAFGLVQILAHIRTADLDRDRIEITRYNHEEMNIEPIS